MESVQETEGFETWSAERVSKWMVENGISLDIAEGFEEEAMDGEALIDAFGTCPGPDCLKEVIPKYGIRVKTYKKLQGLLQSVLDKESEDGLEQQNDSIGQSPVPSTSSVRRVQLQDSSIDHSPAPSASSSCRLREQSAVSVSSDSNVSKQSIAKQLPLPDPFPIPSFRERTELNLSNRKLADDDRKYIVRVLATLLCTYIQRPTMSNCRSVAVSLVRKYAFLKEPESWTQFLYTRCQNTNRKSTSNNGEPAPKKAKLRSTEQHNYASIAVPQDDEEANRRNTFKLKQEALKSKPQTEVVKTLIRRTFPIRRTQILEETPTVDSLVENFPHLKKTNLLALEFDLVMKVDDSLDCFCVQWEKWADAIVSYCRASKNKPAYLQRVLDSIDEQDPDSFTLSAFKCISYFLVPKLRRKVENDLSSYCVIPYLLMEASRGTSPAEVIDKSNNSPHILRFISTPGADLQCSYFVTVEQKVYMECRSIVKALFCLLAVHYVFDLSYNHNVKDFLFFLQDKIAGIDDPTFKKSAIYMNISAAIECYL